MMIIRTSTSARIAGGRESGTPDGLKFMNIRSMKPTTRVQRKNYGFSKGRLIAEATFDAVVRAAS